MQFLAPYKLIPGGRLNLHFLGEHWADLKASGLSDDTIRRAGVYTLSPSMIEYFFRRRFRRSKVRSCLCFPYQGGSFARVKLFPPLGSQKYAQPAQTSARLYMPVEIVDGPIYVVEGEKKTLAACQLGLNAVGIGGVWSWVTHGNPIDDLSRVAWANREAVIVADSDVWKRQDLLRAVYALGRSLQDEGAAVSFVEIPDGASKQGLDDYLVAGGNFESLPVHFIGAHKLARLRPWYQNWRMEKALSQERR